MTKRTYPNDVLEQASEAQAVWSQIDENLTFGPLNMGALVMDINALRNIEQSLAVLESEMAELRHQRETLSLAAWDKVKRLRAGVKSFYGDDSSQYDRIGGTRLSDRKPVRRSPLPSEQAEAE